MPRLNAGQPIVLDNGTMAQPFREFILKLENVTLDSPSTEWSTINNTPTTLAGYGITDAATSAQGALADTAVQPSEIASGLLTENYTQPGADLAVGWYTVATLNSGRATATFLLRDTQSARHQSCTFMASHHYSNGNQISVLSESRYATPPFTGIRIKSLSTYDGAALQVYVGQSTNNLLIAIKDNYQSPSWYLLPSWVLDPTDPGGVSTSGNSTNGTTSAWPSFFVSAEIALEDCISGMGTTGKMAVGESLKVAAGADSGDGVLIGNDSKLVDVDVAHTLGLQSQSVATNGMLQYGFGGVVSGNVGLGNYGSFVIDGGAVGGYEGYSIGGRVVFMHNNGSAAGIYNDVNNQWMMYSILNGATDLRYAGAQKIVTSTTGITVTGTGTATEWTATSDWRLKENIERIQDPERIYDLNGYTFTKEGVESAGLIAQEAEKITPELVHKDEDGYLSLNYNGYIGYLIELVKKQRSMIADLEMRVSVLEAQL